MSLTELIALPEPLELLGHASRSQIAFLRVVESGSSTRILRSDGTAEGTFQIFEAPHRFSSHQVIGDLLVFGVAAGSAAGDPIEVWASNGTPSGTALLFEEANALGAGPFPFDPNLPRPSATSPRGEVLFARPGPRNAVPSQTAWITDGTAVGTRALLPGVASERVLRIVAGRTRAFLLIQDGGAWSVWSVRYDGSAATRVADAFSDTAESMAVLGDSLLFFVPGGRGQDSELFVSDGTVSGTRVFSTLPEGHDVTGSAAGDSTVHLIVADRRGDPPEPPMSLWRTGASGPAEKMLDLGEQPFFLRSGGRTFLVDSPVTEIVDRLWAVDDDGLELLADCASRCLWNERIGTTGWVHQFLLWSGSHSMAFLSDGTAAGTRMVWEGTLADLSFQVETFGEAESVLSYTVPFLNDRASQLLERLSEAGRETVADLGSERLARFRAPDEGLELLVKTSEDDVSLIRLEVSRPACSPSATTLCLGEGRFELEVEWTDFQGHVGSGKARQLTEDTGSFWFFSPQNLELVVKVVDGTAINGHHWVFYGALSDVGYRLTVTDLQTLRRKTYVNPQRTFASRGDTQALLGAPGEVPPQPRPAVASTDRGLEAPEAARRAPSAPLEFDRELFAEDSRGAACITTDESLCLQDRFLVSVRWQDFTGGRGTGTTLPLTADTGGFWFFDAENVELVVKVLDGRALNGKFWVFFGALSDVAYELEVMDTVTEAVRTYTNPARNFGSVGDTQAFDG